MSQDETPDGTAITQAEIDAAVAKDRAEADKFMAEAVRARAQARTADLEARIAGYAAAREHDKRERELSAATHQRIYYFNTEVSADQVHKCMGELAHWHRIDPDCHMEIVFNSPGGSAFAGLELFDYIQELKRAGHKFTTSTRGMAASMAGILLQAGDTRAMGAESYVLIHDISTWAIGKTGDIEDELDLLKKMTSRIVAIFAERSTLSKEAIAKGFQRKNWWLSSDECLKRGFVDEVR